MESNSAENSKESENPAAEPTGELSRVIQESKQAIADATETPLKRPRGRPRGSIKRRRPLDPPAQPIVEGEAAPAPQSLTTGLAPILAVGVKLPFDVAAYRTKFDGFKLSDEEAAAQAELFDHVLAKYLPQLSETNATLVTCFGSLAMLAASKYIIYSSYLEEKKEKLRVEIKTRDEKAAQPQAGGDLYPTVSV